LFSVLLAHEALLSRMQADVHWKLSTIHQRSGRLRMISQ
jgi:hypothetical protein